MEAVRKCPSHKIDLRRRSFYLRRRSFSWALSFSLESNKSIFVASISVVAPDFKNKTRYTPYVSPGSQISHIATNKGNINRQCSIYNVLSIKNITLDNKQWKDNPDLRVKTPIPQGQLTG